MKEVGSKSTSVILVEITSPYSSFPSPKSLRYFLFTSSLLGFSQMCLLSTSQARTVKIVTITLLCALHIARNRRHAGIQTCSCSEQTAFLLLDLMKHKATILRKCFLKTKKRIKILALLCNRQFRSLNSRYRRKKISQSK